MGPPMLEPAWYPGDTVVEQPTPRPDKPLILRRSVVVPRLQLPTARATPREDACREGTRCARSSRSSSAPAWPWGPAPARSSWPRGPSIPRISHPARTARSPRGTAMAVRCRSRRPTWPDRRRSNGGAISPRPGRPRTWPGGGPGGGRAEVLLVQTGARGQGRLHLADTQVVEGVPQALRLAGSDGVPVSFEVRESEVWVRQTNGDRPFLAVLTLERDRLVGRFQGLPTGATLVLARAGR